MQNDRYLAILQAISPQVPPSEPVDLRNAKGSGFHPLVETSALSSRHLPTDDSVWFERFEDRGTVLALALSFAGYEFMDMRMFELLSVVESLAFGGQQRVLDCFNTTGLRLLLFALQRRQHNADTGLETDALTRAVLSKLRARIA